MNMRLIVITFLLLLFGCYQQKGDSAIEAELLTNSQIRLKNGTSNNILVPLYFGELIYTEQFTYNLYDCNLIDIESVRTEPLMFIVMDTLHVGSSKTYDTNFFNTNPAAMLYDSQLVFTFTLYDQKLYDVFKYNIESQRLLYITSYRDEHDKVAFSEFSALVPATTDINALGLNICADN